MTKIRGIDGMSNEEINEALAGGAKFVVFRYTISIVLMTFRNQTHRLSTFTKSFRKNTF